MGVTNVVGELHLESTTHVALRLTLCWREMAQFFGRVVGTKMQKTAKVEVTRMFLHPQVLKVYK